MLPDAVWCLHVDDLSCTLSARSFRALVEALAGAFSQTKFELVEVCGMLLAAGKTGVVATTLQLAQAIARAIAEQLEGEVVVSGIVVRKLGADYALGQLRRACASRTARGTPRLYGEQKVTHRAQEEREKERERDRKR